MKNSKSKSGSSKSKGSSAIEESVLMSLFENELKDIYWAEKALVKALPKMIKKAGSDELTEALENHLEETKDQVTKLERVFELIGKKAVAKKCEAMSGLIDEAEEIMKESEEGPMRDAGIITAAQKVEHYEIATYGTLRVFARTLNLDEEVASILDEILEEEKNADLTLTEVAETSINIEAAMEEEESEEEEE